MIRYSPVVFLLFLASLGSGQIIFVGDPEAVSNVSSPEKESFVTFSQHDRYLAFTRERVPGEGIENIESEKFQSIFDSTWRVRIYSDWEPLKDLFVPIGYDTLGNHYFGVVSSKGGRYSTVIKKFLNPGGVSTEEIPFFKNYSSHLSGCISKGGDIMIVSGEANFTHGADDLYVIKKGKWGWERPINLGEVINSSSREITPFLLSDNKTLFFASDGRNGLGGFDIYYSQRLDETWNNWTKPKNIGEPVNTAKDESSFTLLENDPWAYYVSDMNANGYGDIHRIQCLLEWMPSKYKLVSSETILNIVDSETGDFIAANVVMDGETYEVSDGVFRVDSVAFMLSKELRIESDGYLSEILTINDRGSYQVNMEAVKVGNIISLNHVLFYRQSPDIIEGSEKQLDLVVDMMLGNPNVRIFLKGHTDNQGDPVVNIRLSEERVKTVINYLVDHGVKASRIYGKGFGGEVPIASNETEETRKLNRRVEFEVLEK